MPWGQSWVDAKEVGNQTQIAQTHNHISWVIQNIEGWSQKDKDRVSAAVRSLATRAMFKWDGRTGFIGECFDWAPEYMKQNLKFIQELKAQGIVGTFIEVDEVTWTNTSRFVRNAWPGAGHAGIRIALNDKNKTEFYLDDGTKGGADRVFMQNEVPANYKPNFSPAKFGDTKPK
jgi:hypothetical protein